MTRLKGVARLLLMLLMAGSVALGSLSLVACGGSGDEGAQQSEQQDDCYGDDLPATND